MYDRICQGCQYDDATHLLELDGYTLRHCDHCRLTSVVNPVTTAVYDADYVAERYGKYPTTQRMAQLRLAYVETILRLHDALPAGHTNPFSGERQLLDVGYGNGAFIRWATQNGWNAYGNDVNLTEYHGVTRRSLPDPLGTHDRYRAITFFDALEHFESLQQVRRVSACTDWIFVTAPLPPEGWPFTDDEPLRMDRLTWKHWRPGEHHSYFHPETLEKLFSWGDKGARIRAVAMLMHVSHFEDSIRGAGRDGCPNTFTAALRCQTFAGPSVAP